MYDRRKRKRFAGRNDVLIRTSMDKYQGPGVAAYTYDLSTGGARIVTSKSYPVGAMLRIRVHLAGTNQLVNLDGQVKWLRPRDGEELFEIGVEFLHLTSPAVLSLLRHLYGSSAGAPSSIA